MPIISNADDWRQTKQLCTLLLVLLVVILTVGQAAALIEYLTTSEMIFFVGPLATGLFLAGAYLISRRGHYRLAARLCVITSSAWMLVSSLLSPTETMAHTLYYLAFALFFSSFFLPKFDTLVTIGFHVCGLILLLFTHPLVAGNPIVHPLTFYVLFAILGYILTLYNKNFEHERRAELAESEARYRLILDTANEGIMQVDAETQLAYANPRVAEMLGYEVSELIGRSYFELLHPSMVSESKQRWEQRKQGVTGRRDVLFQHKHGSSLWMLTSSRPIMGNGSEFVGMLTMLTDISERKRAETLEHDERILAETFNEIGALITGTLDLDRVLDLLSESISKVVPHDSAEIMIVEGDTAQIVRHKNEVETDQENAVLDLKVSIEDTRDLREVFHSGKPIIFPNIEAYPGWVTMPGQAWVKSFCTVPICLENKVIGFITLKSQQKSFFSEKHTAQLKGFADYAAIAIQNARLFKQSQALGVAEERQRLARELHDGVNQSLFSANLIAESLPILWERDPNTVRENVQALQRLTRGALAEMRTSLFEMRPEALAETELSGLLRYLTDAVQGKTDLDIVLTVEGGKRCRRRYSLDFTGSRRRR